MSSKIKKLKIRDELLNFGKTQKFFKSVDFTGDPKMDKFILKNPNAFLMAVICDYGIDAQKAWQVPYILKKRLGYFDIERIAKMNNLELERVFSKPPKLHRYIKKIPGFLIKAANKLIEDYNGDAKNIWSNNPSSITLDRKLREFSGIGQKKASMAVNILSRDLKVPIRDKSGIDVSYDVHVKRVFSRSGLSNSDSEIDIIVTARELNPNYPGALDFPAWVIGRTYCHPTNPNCSECPLNKNCDYDEEIK